MKQMVSFRKLSKKEKKKINAARRVTWGFSPITRKKESGKKYDRKKVRTEDGEY